MMSPSRAADLCCGFISLVCLPPLAWDSSWRPVTAWLDCSLTELRGGLSVQARSGNGRERERGEKRERDRGRERYQSLTPDPRLVAPGLALQAHAWFSTHFLKGQMHFCVPSES